MRKALTIALSALVLVTALVHSASAQRRNETRYERLTNDIFTQAAYTGNPAMLENYPIATGAELGITGKEIYNEYPEGPVVVVVHAQAKFYYDNGSREPLYLIGCVRKGKPWFNRVKLVVTTVTVTNRVEVPVDRIVEKEKIVYRDREVERRVEIPCPDCPVGKPTFDFSTTFKGSLAAAGKQLLRPEAWLGIGVGGGVSAVRGGDGGDVLTSVLISAGENAVLKGVVADANRVKITIPARSGGSESFTLKKGDSRSITVGGAKGTASWTDDDGVTVEFPGFPGCTWNRAPKESIVVASYSQAGRDRDEDFEGTPPKTYVPPGPGAGSGDYKARPGGGAKRHVFQ